MSCVFLLFDLGIKRRRSLPIQLQGVGTVLYVRTVRVFNLQMCRREDIYNAVHGTVFVLIVRSDCTYTVKLLLVEGEK